MFNRIGIFLNNLSKFAVKSRRMSSNKIRIGVCQLNCRDNKEENFQIGEKLINQAKQEQAKVNWKIFILFYYKEIF